MFKRFLFLVLAVIFAAGCGIKAQTYVMTKDRVDIGPSGNAGSLTGSGTYQEPEKKTRKVYVLEVSKPASVPKAKKAGETASQTTTQAVAADQPEDVPAPPAVSGSGESVTYTVQKDDTLQKIAKKFYGSYGKWTRVYEANKDKLKNPNFVRPGTVLTIPAGE
ncbi:MAG: LysM peptidoglycan-binding domain-containing protein [Candidatus Omnitrophota bacterium]|nr:LysM peptidoglycan-binding domain-containing protein [Candidatus Omnitrophota bacterium]